jgi:DNA replication protein DnaC
MTFYSCSRILDLRLRPNTRKPPRDMLLMDDFAMSTLNEYELADLAEILEEWSQRRSTVVTSHDPMETWLARLPEPTMAEAICDRLRHNANVLNLKGISMRTTRSLPEVDGQK